MAELIHFPPKEAVNLEEISAALRAAELKAAEEAAGVIPIPVAIEGGQEEPDGTKKVDEKGNELIKLGEVYMNGRSTYKYLTGMAFSFLLPLLSSPLLLAGMAFF